MVEGLPWLMTVTSFVYWSGRKYSISQRLFCKEAFWDPKTKHSKSSLLLAGAKWNWLFKRPQVCEEVGALFFFFFKSGIFKCHCLWAEHRADHDIAKPLLWIDVSFWCLAVYKPPINVTLLNKKNESLKWKETYYVFIFCGSDLFVLKLCCSRRDWI